MNHELLIEFLRYIVGEDTPVLGWSATELDVTFSLFECGHVARITLDNAIAPLSIEHSVLDALPTLRFASSMTPIEFAADHACGATTRAVVFERVRAACVRLQSFNTVEARLLFLLSHRRLQMWSCLNQLSMLRVAIRLDRGEEPPPPLVIKAPQSTKH